jgi:hypothetical protein
MNGSPPCFPQSHAANPNCPGEAVRSLTGVRAVYHAGAVYSRGGPVGPEAGGGSARADGGNGGRRLAVPRRSVLTQVLQG